MSEKSVEEEIKIKAQQARGLARYMSSTQDLVEEQIRKAQQRGEFDNLEGSGRPLDLEENPFEPAELRMVFKILKNNDFAPYWIELGKEIDADLQNLWREVGRFTRYTEMFCAEKHSKAAQQRYDKKKARFYFEQRLELEKINRKIVDFNLHCPTFQLGRSTMIIDNEMYKVIRQVESVIEAAIHTK
jgi:DnaJ family protein C protein 28